MVGLHRAIKIVGPLVFEWEEIECHGLATIDDLFGSESGLCLGLIEDECLGADLKGFLHVNGGGEC